MRVCTDKAVVRDYMESLGMGDLLNKCYGVYERAEDIDWDSLPPKFVSYHTLSVEGINAIGGKVLYGKQSVFNSEEKTQALCKMIPC